MTTEKERFESSAIVFGADGEIGTVERVIVSPVAVRSLGWAVRRHLVIPIETVERADHYVVHVRLTVDEANSQPEYREKDFVAPPADWQSPRGQRVENILFRLPESLARTRLQPARTGQTEAAACGRLLLARQEVVCRDGVVGRLDLVLTECVKGQG